MNVLCVYWFLLSKTKPLVSDSSSSVHESFGLVVVTSLVSACGGSLSDLSVPLPLMKCHLGLCGGLVGQYTL